MKYVFITSDCYPMPIAYHLKAEGYDVTVGMVEDPTDLHVPGMKDDEEPEDRKERLSVYDDIIEKKSLKGVVSFLDGVPKEKRDDYFIFFDFNHLYNVSERVMKMGYKNGLFPTEYWYKMEKERNVGREFAKKNYPDLKFAESLPFKKAEDGIEHITDSDDIWVLKSNGNEGKTIVPKTDDVKSAQAQVVEVLNECRKAYESNGYLLERKIINCTEVTPVIVFYDGVPIYTLAEFENKEYGAGNIGALKGGNQALSIRTDFGAKINKIAFPPAVFGLAEKQPGLAVFDAGLLYDGKDFYFTEFCAMRYGWDGIFSEIVMSDEGKPFVGSYFENLIVGKNPLVNKFGVAVRIFNYEGDLEDSGDPKPGEAMTWDKEVEDNLFLYGVRKEKNKIVCTADRDMIGVATGAGDTMEDAVERAYGVVGHFNFEKVYYRPVFDFLSTEYRSSIPNRIKTLKKFL